MKKIRVSAKNVQKAIEEGLKSLNATQDEVDIKIIDEGGLFKKATVELTLDKEVEEIRQKEEKAKEEIVKEDATEEEEKKPEEKKQSPKEETKKQETDKPKKAEKVDSEKTAIEIGTNFLRGLFEKMNVQAEISAVELENGVTFNASGESVSTLIGKRGETLNAIQDILSNVLRNAGYRETRFYFDVENYKNRREISLTNLAERMAHKVIKSHKPYKLERMSAYERKIIHTHLQNFEGVTTKSEGEEPNRYLVIIPTSKEDNE